MGKHRVLFLPQEKAGTFVSGTVLRDAALDLGILIDSSCAGIGTCGKCKVEVRQGGSDPTDVEHMVLSAVELSKGVRLACQTTVNSEIVCHVPEQSLSTIDQITAWGVDGGFALDPETRVVTVSRPKPVLGDRHFTYDRFRTQLSALGHDVTGDLASMRRYAAEVPPSAEIVHAVVDRNDLLTISTGTERFLGLALDIGTTTVAAKLIDLESGATLGVASAGNPQAALGSDVVARIQYVTRHTGGLRKMQRLIVNQLNELAASVCTQARVRRSDVVKAVIVGNTVMGHILLGISPKSLGTSPYAAVSRGPVRLRARELGLNTNGDGIVYVAPNLASFVGGDITSVLTAVRMDKRHDLTLVIDMGTNGEIVLGHSSRLVCCSSPAGPAWEGACISWGMRAARGAIERAEIVDNRIALRTIGEASPVGICGSGLIDLVCTFLRNGLIERSGRIPTQDEIRDRLPAALVDLVGVTRTGKRSLRVADMAGADPIVVTQDDVRQIQLAKAGIAAGVHTLLSEFDSAPEDIAQVFLAGAFGNHVRGSDVLQLGLVPGVGAHRIHFVGNAALSGAESMIKSREALSLAERIADEIGYVEVAGRPEFEDLFVECIPFPEIQETQ
ncbi:MAG TPA: ASKHA domain-containing protein [Rhodothermia bacterium]